MLTGWHWEENLNLAGTGIKLQVKYEEDIVVNIEERGEEEIRPWALKFTLYLPVYSLKFTFKIAFSASNDDMTSGQSPPMQSVPFCPPVQVENKVDDTVWRIM